MKKTAKKYYVRCVVGKNKTTDLVFKKLDTALDYIHAVENLSPEDKVKDNIIFMVSSYDFFGKKK